MDDVTCSLISKLYERFNARDIDGAVALMQPDVRWANGMEGGRLQGVEAVRRYWTRQWARVSPKATPLSVVLDGGDAIVEVRQVISTLAGDVISDGAVRHVFRFRDGKVASMEIVER